MKMHLYLVHVNKSFDSVLQVLYGTEHVPLGILDFPLSYPDFLDLAGFAGTFI